MSSDKTNPSGISRPRKKRKRINYNRYDATMDDEWRISQMPEIIIDLTNYNIAKKKRRMLSDALARKYGFDDLEAHYELILKLDSIKENAWQYLGEDAMNISLEKDNWRIPKNAPDWKTTRSAATDLAHDLGRFSEKFFETQENPTFMAAVNKVDVKDEFLDLANAVYTLSELLAEVASIERGKGGNRPTAAWLDLFAQECQDFWIDQKTTSAYPKFVDGGVSIPDNPFTEWAKAVMEEAGGFCPRESGTHLNRLKRRKPKQT